MNQLLSNTSPRKSSPSPRTASPVTGQRKSPAPHTGMVDSTQVQAKRGSQLQSPRRIAVSPIASRPRTSPSDFYEHSVAMTPARTVADQSAPHGSPPLHQKLSKKNASIKQMQHQTSNTYTLPVTTSNASPQPSNQDHQDALPSPRLSHTEEEHLVSVRRKEPRSTIIDVATPEKIFAQTALRYRRLKHEHDTDVGSPKRFTPFDLIKRAQPLMPVAMDSKPTTSPASSIPSPVKSKVTPTARHTGTPSARTVPVSAHRGFSATSPLPSRISSCSPVQHMSAPAVVQYPPSSPRTLDRKSPHAKRIRSPAKNRSAPTKPLARSRPARDSDCIEQADTSQKSNKSVTSTTGCSTANGSLENALDSVDENTVAVNISAMTATVTSIESSHVEVTVIVPNVAAQQPDLSESTMESGIITITEPDNASDDEREPSTAQSFVDILASADRVQPVAREVLSPISAALIENLSPPTIEKPRRSPPPIAIKIPVFDEYPSDEPFSMMPPESPRATPKEFKMLPSPTQRFPSPSKRPPGLPASPRPNSSSAGTSPTTPISSPHSALPPGLPKSPATSPPTSPRLHHKKTSSSPPHMERKTLLQPPSPSQIHRKSLVTSDLENSSELGIDVINDSKQETSSMVLAIAARSKTSPDMASQSPNSISPDLQPPNRVSPLHFAGSPVSSTISGTDDETVISPRVLKRQMKALQARVAALVAENDRLKGMVITDVGLARKNSDVSTSSSLSSIPLAVPSQPHPAPRPDLRLNLAPVLGTQSDDGPKSAVSFASELATETARLPPRSPRRDVLATNVSSITADADTWSVSDSSDEDEITDIPTELSPLQHENVIVDGAEDCAVVPSVADATNGSITPMSSPIASFDSSPTSPVKSPRSLVQAKEQVSVLMRELKRLREANKAQQEELAGAGEHINQLVQLMSPKMNRH